ncbi:MAG TPA: LuxR C-terminal-related transcriptional regulator [Croceibacterium sp.]|nr:LuxR C-terminal-related transcriptional regulator [Croceibacterium sp.]
MIAAQVPIDNDGPALTACEVQFVRLVAQGHSLRQIAELLELPNEAVERCRASAMRKIGTDCAAGLTSYAVRHGLVGP